MPSKFALFLTQVFNYLSGFMVIWAVTSFTAFLWPWMTLPINVIGWGVFGAGVWIANQGALSMTIWRRSMHRKTPTFSQQKYICRAHTLGFQPNQEWLPTIAFVACFVAFALMMLFNHWRLPEAMPINRAMIDVPAIMGCLVASLVWVSSNSPDFGTKKNDPPSGPDGPGGHDPDDYGPAGMGARLIPPTPTLEYGERKQRTG